MSDEREPAAPTASPCQSCGACCACDEEWPRFSLESEEQLAMIPTAFVDDDNGRMAWTGTRCAALSGDVGLATKCLVYEFRPDVCRDCQPGDDACEMAREMHGLAPISAEPDPERDAGLDAEE